MHGAEVKPLYTLLKFLVLSALLVTAFKSSAQNLHDSWNTLLTKHVVAINHGHSTEVDYAAIKHEHTQLAVTVFQLGFPLHLIHYKIVYNGCSLHKIDLLHKRQ